LPEVAFFRINTTNPEKYPVYTLIHNRQYRHVAVLFGENQRRQPDMDTLTVLPGFVGSYPNQFFTIASEQLEGFITQLKQAQTETAIAQFYKTYGIRRNNQNFWAIYDSFNQKHQDGKPENAGLFDISRYGNHENGT